MYIGGRGKIRNAIDHLQKSQTFLTKSNNNFRFILQPVLMSHLDLFLRLGHLATPAVDFSQNFFDDAGRTFSNIFTSLPSKEPLVTLCIFLYAQGGKLQAARTFKTNADMLPTAKAITAATKLVFFPLIAPTAATAVVEACLVLVEHIVSYGTYQEELIEDLKQNLTALRVVADRGELVELLHGTFMKELAKFIDIYETVEVMDFSMLRDIISDTGTI